MKFFKYLFVLLSLILIVSCGGEEEDDDWGNDGDGGNSGNNEENGGWESREDKPGKVLQTEGFLSISAIAIGLDDILYVGGATKEESKKSDALLVAFDTKGKELWKKQWDYQESADRINEVVTDKDGNIYVAGRSYNISFIIKFAPDGTKLWEQFLEYDNIFSLTLDSEQNIYTPYNNKIAQYSTDGKELWNNAVLETEQSKIQAIIVDSEKNIYLGGQSSESLFADNAGKNDAFLKKITADGTQVWGQQWGNSEDDYITSLMIDDDNKIYVSGKGTFFKVSSDGEKIWEINQQCYFATICNDNIYCINNNQIYKYNSNGEYLGSLVACEADSLETIACDNKEKVYVSTTRSTKIIKIPSSDIK